MKRKFKKILEDFQEFESVIVAFSGGVDSSLVAYLANKALGGDSLAITANSEIISRREVSLAKKMANEIGISHKIIEVDILSDSDFVENNLNRCYYCKKELFASLFDFASKNDYALVADGTNASEIKEHRPGFKALKELDVYSPLVKYDVSKNEVREFFDNLSLPILNKQSTTCLASRISHNENITREKLEIIEEAESVLFNLGFEQVRVRKHGDIARIEVSRENRELKKQKMDKIHEELKNLGFNYVTLDLKGYRSGSMEEIY